MGKGQLSSACRELQRLGLHDLPIIGLAKDTRRFIDPAGHCRSGFQWIPLPCSCFSASGMKHIDSLTHIISCP